MRIAFVTETWLPHTDGIVTRLLATIRALRRTGHEVLVIAPDGTQGGDTTLDGVTVRTVPTVGWQFLYHGKGWGLPLLRRVERRLHEFEPDVVHVVNPVLLGIAGTIAGRRCGCAVVASHHTAVARYARHYRLGALVPLIWSLQRALYARAQVTLATSSAAIDDLAEHDIAGVRLWPPGVDTELFHPATGSRETSRPIALYVGRLAPEKGLHRLAPLAGPDSPVQLVLVGDGPARAELEGSLPPSTVFTGLLHGSDLADAYRGADLFVFPSTTDTLGLVLLEALASGLPVLAADSPAARSTLDGCEVARLFSPDRPDELLGLAKELLSIPDATRTELALRHVSRHHWDAATDVLLGFYRQALARNSRRPVSRAAVDTDD